MRKPIWTLALGVCLAANGQQPPKLQFEVASVKAAEGPVGPAMANVWAMMPPGIPISDPGRVHIQGQPLRRLVGSAYAVRMNVVFGPAWMDDVRFDIDAKMPAGAKMTDAEAMMISLLEDRFGMQAHREDREMAGFALVVAKSGPKLQPAEALPPPPAENLSPDEAREQRRQQLDADMKKMQAQMEQRRRTGGQVTPGHSTRSWKSVTCSQLADSLANLAGGPVLDETGLTGKYSVTIETWLGTDDQPEQTIFTAVEKLGLKLEKRKVTKQVVVVDRISKTPTEN
jgi:uncharacterized protein (TIGR03435 family)